MINCIFGNLNQWWSDIQDKFVLDTQSFGINPSNNLRISMAYIPKFPFVLQGT